jgi:hypothetical protein
MQQNAPGPGEPDELPAPVRLIRARHLPEHREGRLDHLGPRLGVHLEHAVWVETGVRGRRIPGHDFVASHVGPTPTSTASGGSSA